MEYEQQIIQIDETGGVILVKSGDRSLVEKYPENSGGLNFNIIAETQNEQAVLKGVIKFSEIVIGSRVPTLNGELQNIQLTRLTASYWRENYNYILPGLQFPELDKMEVDLKEAAAFAKFYPDSGILKLMPNIDFTGVYFISVTLTSDSGIKVEKEFYIWVAFVNILFFNVEIVPPINDADPVGRRNITHQLITPSIIDISSKGEILVKFNPYLDQETYEKAVEYDIIVSLSNGSADANSTYEINFDYSYTTFEPS